MEGLVVVLKNQDHDLRAHAAALSSAPSPVGCAWRLRERRSRGTGIPRSEATCDPGTPTSDTRPVAFRGLDPGFANEDGVPTIRIML